MIEIPIIKPDQNEEQLKDFAKIPGILKKIKTTRMIQINQRSLLYIKV